MGAHFYWLSWWGLLLLHLFLALFLMGTAILYYGMMLVPQMAYYATTIQVLSIEYFPVIMAVFATISAV